MLVLPSATANHNSSPASITQDTTYAASPLPFNQAGDTSRVSSSARDNEAQFQKNQSHLYARDLEQIPVGSSTLDIDIGDGFNNSDLWSAAFREAVDSLDKEIDVAILEGKNVEQLFRGLDEIDKEATQGSAFLRGVKYLHSIQVPLERFKLALDLASPLTSLEPTVTTVFGVVRSVTAVSSMRCESTLCSVFQPE